MWHSAQGSLKPLCWGLQSGAAAMWDRKGTRSQVRVWLGSQNRVALSCHFSKNHKDLRWHEVSPISLCYQRASLVKPGSSTRLCVVGWDRQTSAGREMVHALRLVMFWPYIRQEQPLEGRHRDSHNTSPWPKSMEVFGFLETYTGSWKEIAQMLSIRQGHQCKRQCVAISILFVGLW